MIERVLRVPFLHIIDNYRSSSIDKYKQLLNLQWYNHNELKRNQDKKLAALLMHASKNVPYYKHILMKHGVIDKNRVVLKQFSELPILSKDLIREHFNELKSLDIDTRNWRLNSSGGSTGEPVAFIQDADYRSWGHAVKMFFDEWTGYRPGMKKVRLWGAEKDFMEQKKPLRTKLARYIRNELWLNTFHMDNNKMLEYVYAINKFKPFQITAYSESIYEFARYIEKNRFDIHSPSSILSSAGTLYPHMRMIIERVFNSTVYNRYGSREVGDIACESTPGRGLLISSPTHYVEIIREDGTPAEPGELGEIIITLLTNYSMPLLRYKIGDLGIISEENSVCGRGLPVLKEIRGRTNSMLRTSFGVYDSVAISTLLYFKDKEKKQPFQSFSKYQIVQYDRDRIVCKVIIKDSKSWNEEKKIIKDKFLRVFGNNVIIDIKEVEDIPVPKSGKHAYVINAVDGY